MPQGGGRAREVTGGNEPTGLLQDPRGGSWPLGCGSRRATKGEGSSEEKPAHSILFLRGIWLASQTLCSLAFSPGLCDTCLCGSTWSLNPGMPGAGCAPSPPRSRAGPLLPLLSHLLLPECGVLLAICSPAGAPGGRGATEITGPPLCPPTLPETPLLPSLLALLALPGANSQPAVCQHPVLRGCLRGWRGWGRGGLGWESLVRRVDVTVPTDRPGPCSRGQQYLHIGVLAEWGLL